MGEETKTTQVNIDAIVNGIMARSAQFHARPGDILADFFAKLRALLDHDVDNARENGLDVGALEGQGALNIGLARQTLADIAHNLADTEATRSARDNILAREAWPGRAELLKDYSEQLNKLELERLGTAVFVQGTIAQVRACQWEKMGAEYAIERVVAPVIRGTDGLDPEAKETLRRILQDPRKTDKFLAELRHAVGIKAAVDAHAAQSTADLATIKKHTARVPAMVDMEQFDSVKAHQELLVKAQLVGLDADELKMVSLWLDHPNMTKIAKELKISRGTAYSKRRIIEAKYAANNERHHPLLSPFCKLKIDHREQIRRDAKDRQNDPCEGSDD